jgi:radical SAM enzyme (rSAM/lipoprotein system)
MKLRNKLAHFLFNRFRENEIYLHELTYLFWECTMRCNLKCIHCGSDCSADSGCQDMPFNDFLNAILPLTDIYKPETITVAISGGEPSLRPDLSECGKKLRMHGFRWGMVTNGYAYTPELHRSLCAAGMGSITVSLDGLEESHNWLRGSDQSFKRALNAIDLISPSKRLNFDVVTCVNRKNIVELEKIKELLTKHKVRAWRLFTISPIGRAVNNDELFLKPEQLKQLLDFIKNNFNDRQIKVSFSCESYVGEYERKIRNGYFFCHAGINIASILIDGSISACPNINRSFIQGNIYKDSLADVWKNKFQLMRDRSWTKTGICADCGEYGNCLGGAMHMWNEKKDGIMRCIYKEISGN